LIANQGKLRKILTKWAGRKMILLNELLFNPTKEVKQGQPKGQSDRDAHDNNVGDSSDSKMIAVPFALHGVSGWGQLPGGTYTAISINSLVM
jgi:hypothetical protein